MPCSTYQTPEELDADRRQRRRELLAPLQEEIDVLKLELAERDAMLCGVITAVSARERLTHERLETSWSGDGPRPKVTDEYLLEEFRRTYDETKAGVTWNGLMEWWKSHQKRDEQRRQDEAAAQEARRQEIIQRLTPEEREILGL